MNNETKKQIDSLKKRLVWLAHEREEIASEMDTTNWSLNLLREDSPKWCKGVEFQTETKTKEGIV